MWLGRVGFQWVCSQRPSATGSSSVNTPNNLGTCSCAEGALDLYVVGSCWLPLGCLTAAFGRRLSFLIPLKKLGPCSCAEGALDLRLRHVFFLIPQVDEPLVLYKSSLALLLLVAHGGKWRRKCRHNMTQTNTSPRPLRYKSKGPNNWRVLKKKTGGRRPL